MAGSRYRRPRTAAEKAKAVDARDAKLATLHQQLAEQVRALAAGDGWQRWLQVAARFPTYSFNNTILLLRQRPDATHVAGYGLWRELGRQVTKGEKGLMIYAPVTRRTTATADLAQGTSTGGEPTAPAATDNDTSRPPRQLVGFTPAYVWDVSQTSGTPLPEPPRPQLLAGDAPPGLSDRLADQIHTAGYGLSRAPADDPRLGGANGMTYWRTRQVLVRSDVSDAQACKTLAHELGHVLMHVPADDSTTRDCRGVEEVEAESVAYLVAAHHHLDTSDYTFAYVAGWAQRAATADRTIDTILSETGSRILRTARHVIDRTDQADETLTPAELADQTARGSELAERAAAGADRAAAAKTAAQQHGHVEPVADVDRQRLLDIHTEAAAYFQTHYTQSWATAELERRIGTSLAGDSNWQLGYAPASWTGLTRHLQAAGYSTDELLTAGLATRARTGNLVDRFRDRLMFPIHDTGGDVIGFVGRRNPDHDTVEDPLTPKYLNSPDTPIYHKGDQLYGLAEVRDTLTRGGLAVVVEGPVDALAVTTASAGLAAGVAPLGVALTDQQAAELGAVLGAGSARVVVATDNDPAGAKAAARAYQRLTAHQLDPQLARLPETLDPADVATQHGPAALMNAITTAQPLSRWLVDQRVAGADLTTVEGTLAAVRRGAVVIGQLPPAAASRDIAYLAHRTGAHIDTANREVIEAGIRAIDARARALSRDRRDDLDRGQLVPLNAADLAHTSRPPAGSITVPTRAPDTANKPIRYQASIRAVRR